MRGFISYKLTFRLDASAQWSIHTNCYIKKGFLMACALLFNAAEKKSTQRKVNKHLYNIYFTWYMQKISEILSIINFNRAQFTQYIMHKIKRFTIFVFFCSHTASVHSINHIAFLLQTRTYVHAWIKNSTSWHTHRLHSKNHLMQLCGAAAYAFSRMNRLSSALRWRGGVRHIVLVVVVTLLHIVVIYIDIFHWIHFTYGASSHKIYKSLKFLYKQLTRAHYTNVLLWRRWKLLAFNYTS